MAASQPPQPPENGKSVWRGARRAPRAHGAAPIKRRALLRLHERERGFAIGAVMFLLTMIGVGGAVLYSGYSQVLRTNIEITRDQAIKNDLLAAARTFSATSALINGGLNLQPPAELPFASADSAKLPSGYNNAGNTGSPTAVGVLPAGAGTRQLDPLNRYYIYCRWENATSPGTDPSFMIISAGSDGVLDTLCGDTTAQNDDRIQLLNVAQAIDRANVWQYQTATGGPQVQFGITGNAVRVTSSGDISANTLTLAGPLAAGSISLTTALPIAQGGTGATTAAGARTNLGAGAMGDTLFTAVTAAGARGALGSTAVGDALFTAADAGAARTTLGATTVGDALFTAADEGVALTALGASELGSALFSNSDAGDSLIALGATSIGLQLFSASTQADARTTLGATAMGSSVFTAGSAAAARAALGSGATGDAVFVAGTSTEALTALGLIGSTATLDIGITGTANTAVYLSDGANILSGTVPVNRGGTGAATAADARTNLGADSATNLTSGTLSWTRLPTSGAVAGAYNWGTVNAYGIVEQAQNVAITSATNLDITGSLYFGGVQGLRLTSTGNPIIGNTAMSATAQPHSIAIGRDALAATVTGFDGGYNVAIGHAAMRLTTSGNANTAVGSRAMEYTTTGAANTAVGFLAMRATTTGQGNTAVGSQALEDNIDGTYNVAIGRSTLSTHQNGYSNTAVGSNALVSQYGGDSNTAVGGETAVFLGTGNYNTVLGSEALYNFETGNSNTALGANALYGTQIYNFGIEDYIYSAGDANTAVGAGALYSLTSGNNNTALGTAAGESLADGSQNTLLGYFVGSGTLTSGSGNILIGTDFSLDVPAAATSNWLNIGNAIYGTNLPNVGNAGAKPRVAIGTGITAIPSGISFDLGTNTNSMRVPLGTTVQRPTGLTGMLRYNTTTANLGLEYYDGAAWQSLLSTATGGSARLALGASASATNPARSGEGTTGLFSGGAGQVSVASAGVEVGRFSASGLQLTTATGAYQVNGMNALRLTSTGNPIIGNTAMSATAQPTSIAIGRDALAATVTGVNGGRNVAIGDQAMRLTTSGSHNTAVGSRAMESTTAGAANTAVGAYGLYSNTGGSYNVAIGFEALYYHQNGIGNTAVGGNALVSQYQGNSNTAVGNDVLYNFSEGSGNTVVGAGALYETLLGTDNTVVGTNAMAYLFEGSANTVLGKEAGFLMFDGTNNTILGYQVGQAAGGANNILIGTSSAVDLPSSSTSNWINIGNQFVSDWETTGSEAMGLNRNTTGTPGTTALIVGTGANNGNGATLTAAGVWTNASDRRIKEEIKPLDRGLDTVMRLRPVAYKMRETHLPQIGFIAQEVEPLLPELVVRPENMDDPAQHYTMSYGNMVAVTVKAIQELKAENDNLRAEVAALRGAVGGEAAESAAPLWVWWLLAAGGLLASGGIGLGVMLVRLRREMRQQHTRQEAA